MSEPTATELQILRAENSALHSRAEMDRIDYLAAVRRAEQAEAKLDASERAAAALRDAIADTKPRALVGSPDWHEQEDRRRAALSSDAGRDYVPRSEVDAAWRKGMTDAAMIIVDGESATRIRAARDASALPTEPKPAK